MATLNFYLANRVEVIGPEGREYIAPGNVQGVELAVQDDGQTIKIFLTSYEDLRNNS